MGPKNLAKFPSPAKSHKTSLKKIKKKLNGKLLRLVSKCSVTLASVAAPPPGVQQGFGGPNYPRHPRLAGGSATPRLPRAKISVIYRGVWDGVRRPFGGGVAATPLQDTRNCGKSRDLSAPNRAT